MLPLDNKKLNEIAKLEKAIKKRWGEEAIKTPQSEWDEDKEKDYKEQQKDFAQKIQSNNSEALEGKEGFFITKRLLSKESKSKCSNCSAQIKTLKDETCKTKWGTCFKCYVKWIEGREERWKKGWRPNEDNQSETS